MHGDRTLGGLAGWDRSMTAEAAYRGRMVPAERIELPTFGLQNRCTTAVLRRPWRTPIPVPIRYSFGSSEH